MSALVSCPACDVELEVPPNFSESVVDCPSCSNEFELEVEANPYEAPKSRVGRRGDSVKAPKFPGVCTAMSIIIIILEVFRMGLFALLVVGMNQLKREGLMDGTVQSAIYLAMAIMGVLIVLGLSSSIMMLSKKPSAGIVAKIYAGFILAGLAFSFISFNLGSIIVNGLIALFLIISIINYNSWLRQNRELEKLDRRRSRGQQRKRPSGRLKKRGV